MDRRAGLQFWQRTHWSLTEDRSMLEVTHFNLPLHWGTSSQKDRDICLRAMSALETKVRSDAAIILEGDFIVGGQESGLHFQGSITATTPEGTQSLSSEDHLRNMVASVRTATVSMSTKWQSRIQNISYTRTGAEESQVTQYWSKTQLWGLRWQS